METYRKNYQVTTENQGQALLDAKDDFTDNPVVGQPAPLLDSNLLKIWNGGTHLPWQWDDESQQEYDQRTAKEAADADELALLQSDNDHFIEVKIRQWRNGKLSEWIDDTFLKPLKYNLTAGQITERTAIRQELIDWLDLDDFTTYKTDAEIDALKPSAPSWIV